MNAIPSELLDEAIRGFGKYRELGEGAMAQLDEEDFFREIDPEANSVAVIVKHLRGNMISRWTDFLTSDGEKPDRDRDTEFEIAPGTSREEVERWWTEGWQVTLATLQALRPTDLGAVVTIGGEPLSVLQAILRNLNHTAYHVGQIVMLAKHFRQESWRTLSIPKRR